MKPTMELMLGDTADLLWQWNCEEEFWKEVERRVRANFWDGIMASFRDAAEGIGASLVSVSEAAANYAEAIQGFGTTLEAIERAEAAARVHRWKGDWLCG